MFALLLAFTIPLWDGKAPHAVGDTATDKPALAYLAAPKDKANGTAVVVCPGGGYGGLAMDHEGKQVAEFLNGLGVHAFVLKYRTANKERPGPLHPAPLEDVQRAIRAGAGEGGGVRRRPGPHRHHGLLRRRAPRQHRRHPLRRRQGGRRRPRRSRRAAGRTS